MTMSNARIIQTALFNIILSSSLSSCRMILDFLSSTFGSGEISDFVTFLELFNIFRSRILGRNEDMSTRIKTKHNFVSIDIGSVDACGLQLFRVVVDKQISFLPLVSDGIGVMCYFHDDDF